MKASNKGWDQCGNAQAVTNEHQIILAADVTDQANDVRQTVPMVDQTRANLDAAGVNGGDQGGAGRRGLLQRDEREGSGAARHRGVSGDRTAEASREGGGGPARSDSRRASRRSSGWPGS